MKNYLNSQQIGYLTCFFSKAHDQLLAEAVKYILSLSHESINECLGLSESLTEAPLRDEIKKYFQSQNWKRCYQQEVNLFGRYCSEVLFGIMKIKSTRKLNGPLNENRWNIVKNDVSNLISEYVEMDNFKEIQELFIMIRGTYQYLLSCSDPYCLQFEIRNPELSLDWFSYADDLIQTFRIKTPLRQYLTDMQTAFVAQAKIKMKNPENLDDVVLFLEKMREGGTKSINILTDLNNNSC